MQYARYTVLLYIFIILIHWVVCSKRQNDRIINFEYSFILFFRQSACVVSEGNVSLVLVSSLCSVHCLLCRCRWCWWSYCCWYCSIHFLLCYLKSLCHWFYYSLTQGETTINRFIYVGIGSIILNWIKCVYKNVKHVCL